MASLCDHVRLHLRSPALPLTHRREPAMAVLPPGRPERAGRPGGPVLRRWCAGPYSRTRRSNSRQSRPAHRCVPVRSYFDDAQTGCRFAVAPTPFLFVLTVLAPDGSSVLNALVGLWQADPSGVYAFDTYALRRTAGTDAHGRPEPPSVPPGRYGPAKHQRTGPFICALHRRFHKKCASGHRGSEQSGGEARQDSDAGVPVSGQ